MQIQHFDLTGGSYSRKKPPDVRRVALPWSRKRTSESAGGCSRNLAVSNKFRLGHSSSFGSGFPLPILKETTSPWFAVVYIIFSALIIALFCRFRLAINSSSTPSSAAKSRSFLAQPRRPGYSVNN
ncbi:hypothetical protein B0H12DRAFT_1117270 [Mycena haematopus]|nr:hypothetical protein B0H12DRAFT_1117270 [Mycena haematopus]